MKSFHNIRGDVAGVAARVFEEGLKALPLDSCSLSGEILEFWRRGDFWEMTLRDVREDDLSIAARVPSSLREPPPVGHTVCLIGKYDVELDNVDVSFRLVFVGTDYHSSFYSNESVRSRERRELIDSLRNEFGDPKTLLSEPRRVALVTSKASSAKQDFLSGLGKWRGEIACEEVLIPLEAGSASDIAGGIRHASALGVDLIVIARGGGRKIMLQRFSHAEVIRAVAEVGSGTPVIVAIGHERDRVAAETFAWRRASTPSDAGRLVADNLRIFRWRSRQADSRPPDKTPSKVAEFSPPSVEPFQRLSAPQVRWTPRRRSRKGPFRLLLFIGCVGGLVYLGWSLVMREDSGAPEAETIPKRGSTARPSQESDAPGHRKGGRPPARPRWRDEPEPRPDGTPPNTKRKVFDSE